MITGGDDVGGGRKTADLLRQTIIYKSMLPQGEESRQCRKMDFQKGMEVSRKTWQNRNLAQTDKIVASLGRGGRRSCNHFARNYAQTHDFWTQVAQTWRIVLLNKKILGYNRSYCGTRTKYDKESWWFVLLRTVPQMVIIQTETAKRAKSAICEMLWQA